MVRAAALGLLLVAPLSCGAQYDVTKPLTKEEVLLGRIRNVVSSMLSHMPNFTCVETIERFERAPGTRRARPLDTVRLEVAYVEGNELYAWPGSPRFEEHDVTKLVSGPGGIGTGDFVLHAKSIFFGPSARFNYLGIEELNSRKLHKFHYRIPMLESRYLMRMGRVEGEVGYQGHVWNDAETLELVRIEMMIDEIPPQVPMKQGYKLIDYGRVPIGGTVYVLPASMEMTLTDMSGGESRNHASFSACKQYTGESTLTFEDPPPEAKAKQAPIHVTLPAGLNVPVKLAATLDLAKAAVGDVVPWEVSKDVERTGRVLIPKGAKIEMRLDLVICRDYPMAHCYVALVPGRFTFENKGGAFAATLESPALDRTIAITLSNARPEFRMPPPELANASRGASCILVRGMRGKLASGFATTWRTLEVRGEEKQ